MARPAVRAEQDWPAYSRHPEVQAGRAGDEHQPSCLWGLWGLPTLLVVIRSLFKSLSSFSIQVVMRWLQVS